MSLIVSSSNRSTNESPVRFRTDIKSVISPVVESGCHSIRTSLSFEYQIRSVQNELRHKFPTQSTKDLIIEPYQFNNFIDDELLMVFLKVTETIDSSGHKASVEVQVSPVKMGFS